MCLDRQVWTEGAFYKRSVGHLQPHTVVLLAALLCSLGWLGGQTDDTVTPLDV